MNIFLIFLANAILALQPQACMMQIRLLQDQIGMFANAKLPSESTVDICPLVTVHIGNMQSTTLNDYAEHVNASYWNVILGSCSYYNHHNIPQLDIYTHSTQQSQKSVAITNRNVEMGEQLFVNYGSDWFVNRNYTEVLQNHNNYTMSLPGCPSLLVQYSKRKMIAKCRIVAGTVVETARALWLPSRSVDEKSPLNTLIWHLQTNYIFNKSKSTENSASTAAWRILRSLKSLSTTTTYNTSFLQDLVASGGAEAIIQILNTSSGHRYSERVQEEAMSVLSTAVAGTVSQYQAAGASMCVHLLALQEVLLRGSALDMIVTRFAHGSNASGVHSSSDSSSNSGAEDILDTINMTTKMKWHCAHLLRSLVHCPVLLPVISRRLTVPVLLHLLETAYSHTEELSRTCGRVRDSQSINKYSDSQSRAALNKCTVPGPADDISDNSQACDWALLCLGWGSLYQPASQLSATLSHKLWSPPAAQISPLRNDNLTFVQFVATRDIEQGEELTIDLSFAAHDYLNSRRIITGL